MFEQKLSKIFDENLIFCETYKFCNHDINKFISQNVFTHVNIWLIGKNAM